MHFKFHEFRRYDGIQKNSFKNKFQEKVTQKKKKNYFISRTSKNIFIAIKMIKLCDLSRVDCA